TCPPLTPPLFPYTTLFRSGVPHRIGVAAHRMHRRDSRQLVQNLVGPDVAGVEDELDSLERGEHLGPKQAMGIGDQPHQHSVGPAQAVASGSHRRAIVFSTPRWSSTRPTMKSTRSSMLDGR